MWILISFAIIALILFLIMTLLKIEPLISIVVSVLAGLILAYFFERINISYDKDKKDRDRHDHRDRDRDSNDSNDSNDSKNITSLHASNSNNSSSSFESSFDSSIDYFKKIIN